MDYSCLQLLSSGNAKASHSHKKDMSVCRQRHNMNKKLFSGAKNHGVQRHWIGCPFMGENLREMEADDIRLTIF